MDACSHGMMTKVIFLGICIVVVVVGDGVGIADFERLGFCFPRAATSGSRELLRRVQGQGPGYVVTAVNEISQQKNFTKHEGTKLETPTSRGEGQI